MKKNRKPQPISREYYESLVDAANYLDFALTELDGGDRYETMSTLLDARLMVLNVYPSDGSTTCRMLGGRYGYPFICSECGAEFDVDIIHGELRYCPNCGRTVVA